jgi:hypothetical protein
VAGAGAAGVAPSDGYDGERCLPAEQAQEERARYESTEVEIYQVSLTTEMACSLLQRQVRKSKRKTGEDGSYSLEHAQCLVSPSDVVTMPNKDKRAE